MKYELTRADGTVLRMTLLSGDVTPQTEIDKWDIEDRTGPREVVSIKRVAEFKDRPQASAIVVTADMAPTELHAVILQIAEALADANRRIASLEATMQQVGEAI